MPELQLPTLPDWLTGLFQQTAPSAAPEGPAPAPTGPNPNPTPEQAAQAVIQRYWLWQAAGPKTTAVDAQGNATTDESKAKKDSKGAPLYYPIDPATGKPDPDFPTIESINAAESLLTRKQTNDPDAVAAAKAQAAANLDETKARTNQIQQGIDKANGTMPPATVQPGEGVRQPDGTYTVPVPTKPPGPTKTQAQIDQEAADAHTKSVRDAANSRTPEQTAALELSNARTLEADRAHSAIEVEKGKIQAQIDAGTLLPADAAAALKEKYDEISANYTAGLQQANEKYKHDLDQPNVDRTAQLAQQNADSADQARKDQAAQADRNQQSDVYKTQATQASSFMDQLTKAGVAPSMATVQATTDPLWLALHMAHQEVAKGTVPPTAIPTASAPVPAAATTAVAPAPATAPVAVGAAAGADPLQSGIAPPPYGGP